ncbi:MAG: hypothetical protein KGQ59_06345 [Bdellovibrionales bacterium]|nr:hypothetical protein [Bdellovibrionales bacterium]
MKSTLLRHSFGTLTSMTLLLTATLVPLDPAHAEVSEKLEESAKALRLTQSSQINAEKLVQTVKEAISAKKEVIHSNEQRIQKLHSDQKAEDRLAFRDKGASEEAKAAREITKRDRDTRISETREALKADREELKHLETSLERAQRVLGLIKERRQSAHNKLKKTAEQEHLAQNCEKSSLLKQMGTGIGNAFDSIANITRSRAARDEREVQYLVKLAYCDPAQAVNDRRLAKERSTDVYKSEHSEEIHLEASSQSAL